MKRKNVENRMSAAEFRLATIKCSTFYGEIKAALECCLHVGNLLFRKC